MKKKLEVRHPLCGIENWVKRQHRRQRTIERAQKTTIKPFMIINGAYYTAYSPTERIGLYRAIKWKCGDDGDFVVSVKKVKLNKSTRKRNRIPVPTPW